MKEFLDNLLKMLALFQLATEENLTVRNKDFEEITPKDLPENVLKRFDWVKEKSVPNVTKEVSEKTQEIEELITTIREDLKLPVSDDD